MVPLKTYYLADFEHILVKKKYNLIAQASFEVGSNIEDWRRVVDNLAARFYLACAIRRDKAYLKHT